MDDKDAGLKLGTLMKFIVRAVQDHSYAELIAMLDEKAMSIYFNHIENKNHWLGQQKIHIAIMKNQDNFELERLYFNTYGFINFSDYVQVSFITTIMSNGEISELVRKEVNNYLYYLIKNKNKKNDSILNILKINIIKYNDISNKFFIDSF